VENKVLVQQASKALTKEVLQEMVVEEKQNYEYHSNMIRKLCRDGEELMRDKHVTDQQRALYRCQLLQELVHYDKTPF
jgi:arginine/lysine/ornithine decarboxylase